ncbi:MAG: hypothetical protein EXS00_08460 [Phycisphaerales bacterium]|nr:hypothetical protein [Phycisphaerales bacterium]
MIKLGMVVVMSAVFAAGCAKPEYDTSTPEKTIAAIQQMAVDGRLDLIPTMIEIPVRDVTFADGVTEESAVGDVREKAAEMLTQLWRVSKKLQARFPGDLTEELKDGKNMGGRGDFGPIVAGVLANPFSFISQQQARLSVLDMEDGTAALLWDDEPLLEGAISMIETSDGWKFTFPYSVMQSSEYFPDSREEWAVVASMLLSVEGSLGDFEDEIDQGKFRNLSHAGERAGRLLGESVIVQSAIYAMMKRGK